MPERVYIALDLETTGLDAKRDSIIEIGAVCFQGNQILDRFVSFVNPQRTIPLRVQQITQIRNSDVAQAPTIDAVIPELLAFVRNDVAALVAHNAAFDLGFLRHAGIDFQRPVFDTFELAAMLLPRANSYSLGELCRTLAVPLTNAHRALADAEATALLFMQLQQRLVQIPPATLAAIVERIAHTDTPHRSQYYWAPALLFATALETATTAEAAAISTAPTQSPPSMTVPPQPLTEDSTYHQPITAAAVEDFFAVGGHFAQQLTDTFEVRRGQIEMAQQVTQALNNGTHLLLEAGTGIGKSMAYLVPAALWSTTNGRRVVIATNTITLQEQLLQRDIPLLQQTFRQSQQRVPSATLLKGRHHYFCAHRFEQWHADRRLSAVELTFFTKILLWLLSTEAGDVEEIFLATPTERALWQEVCSDPTTCTPERCGPPRTPEHRATPVGQSPHAIETIDFFYRARQQAEDAHLLIVNHALLIADLVNGGHLLPPYSHLVVDEAHRFDEVATEQLTYRADWRWLVPLLQRLTVTGSLFVQCSALATERGQIDVTAHLHELADEATGGVEQLNGLQERLLAFVQNQRTIRADAGYAQQLYLDQSRRIQPQWSQIEIEWEQLRHSLQATCDRLATLRIEMERYHWQDREATTLRLQSLRITQEKLSEAVLQLNAIITQGSNIDAGHTITWAELHENEQRTGDSHAVSLLAAPLYVNEILEKDLVLQQRAAIFTGATLRTGSGFTYIRDRLGLWHATALTIDSPFDYEWSTLLSLPSDMPQPDHPYYQAAVERAIVDAALATNGRTLALFTSYAQLRTTADAIRTELDQAGITVLEHGTSSRSRLLREYRRLEKAVLLGTRSFWEGVDLPGDELQCLLIVKLPFAVPSDPLVAARCQDLENSFGDYMLPDAILRFRQGFGRLIRREGDRGVVIMLDSRLWRKSYGSAFLESLPRCTISRAALSNLVEEIDQWLNEHGKN